MERKLEEGSENKKIPLKATLIIKFITLFWIRVRRILRNIRDLLKRLITMKWTVIIYLTIVEID